MLKLWQKSWLALLAIGLAFRWFALDHIPGITGDEAWSAAQARLWLQGEPSRWVTPTGRILDPFYSAPTLALQSLFSPSPWLLRLTAALSGSLAVLLAAIYLPRRLPAHAARIATVWIACSPFLIAYSRVAWEPSQIPLASLGVAYFALGQSPLAVAAALIAAVCVHSINLLLAPIAVAPLAWDYWTGRRPLPSARVLLGAAALGGISLVWVLKNIPSITLPPLPSPFSAWLFVQGWSRIVSGLFGPAGFVTQPPGWGFVAWDGLVILGTPALLAWRWRALEPRYRAFVAGVGISTLALLFAGGPTSVTIGNERHCLYLAIPTLISLALATPATRRALIATHALAAFALASLAGWYLVPAMAGQVPREASVQYRAGPVDPKVAATRWITVDSAGKPGPLRVLAEDWWSYWIVVAFAEPRAPKRLELRHLDAGHTSGLEPEGALRSFTDIGAFMSLGGYAIGIEGDGMSENMAQLTSRGMKLREEAFRDYSGRPYVRVWSRGP